MVANGAGDAAGSAVPAAWSDICQSFVTAASDLMKAFALGFVKIPNVDRRTPESARLTR
jgi:hypothetical protein